MTEARITKVPLHRWVVRAVLDVSSDEAMKMARGANTQRPIVETVIRYEGPHCLNCGVTYGEQTTDECTTREQGVRTRVEWGVG